MRERTLVGLAVVSLSLVAWLALHLPEVRARSALAVAASADALDDSPFAETVPAHEPSAELATSGRAIADVPEPVAADFVAPRGGTIDVRVLRGDEPVAGVPVGVSKSEDVEALALLFAPQSGAGAERTDAAGTARFVELADDVYTVRVRSSENAAWFANVELSSETRRAAVTFGLGTSRVSGRVYRRDGAPARRVAVYASIHRAEARILCTATDDAGAYELSDLPAGFLSIAAMDGLHLEAALVGTRELELEDGALETVDIGSPGGLVRWRGVVRLANGEPIIGPGQMEIGPPVRERPGAVSRRAERESLHFRSDGRVDVEIAAGRYEIRRVGTVAARSQPFTIVGPQCEQDVVLRGGSVRGAVRYVGKLAEQRLGMSRATRLRLASDAAGGATHDPCVRDGDRFLFCGVPPGAYRLRAEPWRIVGAPPEGLAVVVTAGALDVAVELTVTDP